LRGWLSRASSDVSESGPGPAVEPDKQSHLWVVEWGPLHLQVTSYLAVLLAEWLLTVIVLVGSAVVVVRPTNDAINSAAVAIVGTVVGYWFGSRTRYT
jgi:hypothetical protein